MNILIPVQQNNNTNLVLGMDFENSLTDFQNPSRVFTNYGLTLSNSQKINGTYSLLNPVEPAGSSNFVSTPLTTDLGIANDFTIEFWHYNLGSGNTLYSGGYQTFLGTGYTSSSSSWNLIGGTMISNNYAYFVTNSNLICKSASTVPLNTWTHHCWSRQGSTLKYFMNGTLSSQTTWTGSWANASYGLDIGGIQDARLSTGYGYTSMGGNMDRLRIWKYCKYSNNFTPLTSLN